MSTCAWEGFFSSAQRKRWQEAIPHRFSCRSFSAPADMTQKSALDYTAARAGLPGVRLVLSECDCNRLFFPIPFVPRIEYAAQYAAVIIDPAVQHAALHAGITGQALVLEMTSLGLGSCWVSGNFRRSAVDIPLVGREKVVAVIPFGHPAPQSAGDRKRKPLKELCLDDPAEWPNWAFQAAEAARQAPSAINAQPWLFSYSGNTMRLSGRGFGGINYGIAVLHMLCALNDLPHQWRWSGDGKGLLINMKEEHDVI